MTDGEYFENIACPEKTAELRERMSGQEWEIIEDVTLEDTKKTFVRVRGRDIAQFQCEPIGFLDLAGRLDRQDRLLADGRSDGDYAEGGLLRALQAGNGVLAGAKLTRYRDGAVLDICDDALDLVAGLFDAQRDAQGLRYDPEFATQFDGYERLGPAAVAGEVAFIKEPDRIAVYRITDAEILGGQTWTPSAEENEVLDHWTSTASGRIDLAHKTIDAGSLPLAIFWGHTYD